MALHHYLYPTDSATDPQDPLSPAVLHVVIDKVNTELDASDEKVKPVTLTTANGWHSCHSHISVVSSSLTLAASKVSSPSPCLCESGISGALYLMHREPYAVVSPASTSLTWSDRTAP